MFRLRELVYSNLYKLSIIYLHFFLIFLHRIFVVFYRNFRKYFVVSQIVVEMNVFFAYNKGKQLPKQKVKEFLI